MQINHIIAQNIINEANSYTYETGGIIGSSSTNVIDCYAFDKGIQSNCRCTYSPNVKEINKQIEEWSSRNISFCGIYHSHFGKARTFSDSDKKYIKTIMECMPPSVDFLNFPIILIPEGIFVNYIVKLDNGKLTIKEDTITLI